MSRGADLGLWLLAGTVSVAVHAGGVSAALLMAEGTRDSESPQARLEVISLPTTTAKPVSSLVRAEATNAKRLAASTLQTVKPEIEAAQAAKKVAPAALDGAKPNTASTAAPEGLEPAQAETLAALDGAKRASAAKPTELKPSAPQAAIDGAKPAFAAAAPLADNPSKPEPDRSAGSAPDHVAAVSNRPLRAPDAKDKSVAAVVAPESVAAARAEPGSKKEASVAQLAPAASASVEATATVRAKPVKPNSPLTSATTRVAPIVNVPVASAPAAVPPPSPSQDVATTVPASNAGENGPASSAAAPGDVAAQASAGQVDDPVPSTAATVQPGDGVTAEQEDDTGSGEQDVALLVPAIPSGPVPAPIDPYASAMQFLQQRDSGWCLLVMPAEADGRLGLEGFADQGAALDSFLEAFKSETKLDAATRSGTVSPAQCRVLNFARNLARYPVFSLRFKLYTRAVGSGGTLAGTIENAGASPVHLLLVDDEGKVQNLDQFLSRSGTGVSFSAPVTLTSGPVATDQLLVALAGPSELKTIANLDGDKADQFFNALTEELAGQDVSPDIAIASFSVQ